MMSHKLLVAAVAAALLAGASTDVLAQQQRKVVLKNVNALPGASADAKEEVDGVDKVAIPFTNAGFDDQGNWVIDCALNAGNCPNIGTSGGSGTPGSAPEITFQGPANPVAASNTAARLYWSTTGAQNCQGRAAPTGVVASTWEKEWPATTTAANGFPVGGLARHPTDPTSYEFTLRCFSTPNLGVGAYKEEKHTVTLAPSGGSSGGGGTEHCNTYLAELQANNPTEYQRYLSYLGTSRGFTEIRETFTARTGAVLGTSMGSIGGGGLPKSLNDKQYVALSFSIAEGKQATINFMGSTPGEVIEKSPLVMTISPCPGDFRPRLSSSGDHYGSSTSCRVSAPAETFKARMRTTGTTYCNTPAGKTMYLNIARQNLMLAPGATIPAVNCGTGNYCGLAVSLEN